ncbi:ubiquitin-like domain-containing protein [Alteribacter natronophilus]|uniref:ubiquitin-like domain-containing protein n=1 Tax=Alteribacter natronophilus TaxID=2583810 RepID=UPI00110DF1EA|nr:G5 and 3D domain-containing protein [Alteribacter natronophilus]TMW69966.1 DUF348 domain-containing protein [Alteribacter natronophilus]
MADRMKRFLTGFITGKKLAISSVGLAIVAAAAVFAFYEITKTTVTIVAAEEEVQASTHADTVEEVLEEHGIELGKHDQIEPALDTEIKNELDITITEAIEVQVLKDNDLKDVWTTAPTVEDLFAELEIEIGEHDFVHPSLERTLSSEMIVVHNEAFELTVYRDGEEENIWTTSTTVADFLNREDITLDELDRVEPEIHEYISESQEITVIRVEKVTDVVEETIDFATVTRNDSSLEEGKREVVQSGSDGTLAKHYEVTIEDGEEVSRELVKEEMIEEGEDRIVAVGTKQPVTVASRGSSSPSSSSSSSSSASSSSGSSSDSGSSGSSSGSSASSGSSSSQGSSGGSSSSDSGSSGGGSWQTFEATAYTADCSGCSGITATGINLRENPDAKVVAVDPSVIPLGSRVEIRGYGTYVAGDTGGAIQGRKIDIFMPSGAGSFGRKNVEVRILD